MHRIHLRLLAFVHFGQHSPTFTPFDWVRVLLVATLWAIPFLYQRKPQKRNGRPRSAADCDQRPPSQVSLCAAGSARGRRF
jgi:hypothetical protein